MNRLITKEVDLNTKEKILKLVRECDILSEFDTDLVTNIKEFDCPIDEIPFTGKTELVRSVPMHFEIILYKTIIKCIVTPTKSYNFSKAVILHELLHCNEISISSKIIGDSPYFLTVDSTYKFLLKLGIEQWSEYYAHYNSCKYYKTNPDIEKSLKSADNYLTVFKNELSKNSLHLQMPMEFLEIIENFVRSVIIIASQYNRFNDSNNLYIFKNEFSCFNKYLVFVIKYMKKLYMEFPKWVSKEEFVKLGLILFSFTKIYNIDFSTKNLSDNFMFKKGQLKCPTCQSTNLKKISGLSKRSEYTTWNN